MTIRDLFQWLYGWDLDKARLGSQVIEFHTASLEDELSFCSDPIGHRFAGGIGTHVPTYRRNVTERCKPQLLGVHHAR
jgi:hypothetical protein